VLFFFDYTHLCRDQRPDWTNSSAYPCVPSSTYDTVLNTTATQFCPANDHPCYFLTVANVPVAYWALFLFVNILGFAILRAIVSIIWWIMRSISGKHGILWTYLKPLDGAVNWLVWDLLFFITFNTWLFSATPLVYQVCIAVSTIIVVAGVVTIIAWICATWISRVLSQSAREHMFRVKSEARLLDKLLKNNDASSNLAAKLSFRKVIKNVKKTLTASASGNDVVVEMGEKNLKTDADLEATFNAIDKEKRELINREEVNKYTELDKVRSADLWAVLCSDPDGEIVLEEFIQAVRKAERVMEDALSNLENRDLVSRFIHHIVLGLFVFIGVTIASEAIQLHISTVLVAITILTTAVMMGLNGVFSRVFSAFIFVVVSRPYYRNDIVTIGADTVKIAKVTLLNTYAWMSDGKWVMFDNAGIAAGKLVNLSRSRDAVFTYEAAVHVDTPKKDIDTFEKTVRAYVDSMPHVWRDLGFTITQLSNDNKLSVEVRVFLRGVTWSQTEVYSPHRADLWLFVHRAAAQVGIFNAPKSPETVLVPVVVADVEAAKKDKEKPKEKEEKPEETREEDEKKAEKKKSKKEKKDKAE